MKLFALAMMFEDNIRFECAAGWTLAASKEEAIKQGTLIARERHPGRLKYQCSACEVPLEMLAKLYQESK